MDVKIAVDIGQLKLRNTELAHLEIHEALGDHCRCTLQFDRDAEDDVVLENLLGEPVKITLKSEEAGTVTAFEGEVVAGDQTHLMGQGSRFTIEGVSASQRLEYRNTAFFPESQLADVAKKVGADVVDSVKGRGARSYLQMGETDFAFLHRLADDHGCYLRTGGKKPEIRNKPITPAVDLVWGKNLLDLTARSRLVNHGYKGSAYQIDEKRDHRFHGIRKRPSWTGGAKSLTRKVEQEADKHAGGGDHHVEFGSSRTAKLADFKKALEAESERVLGAAVLVEGTAVHPGLSAGYALTIGESGGKKKEGPRAALPADGKFMVTSVHHVYDGQIYSSHFVATPWANFTNPARPARHLMPGMTSAIVVDNVDPEKLGRVKVRFPWENDGADNNVWVRITSPYAGNARGMMFIPEIDDEVLVAFEHGDPEFPVVIGSMWNGKDVPPEQADPGDNAPKRIVTRSGNTIQLIDEEGKERIEIFSPKGQCWLQLHTDGGGHPLITLHSEGDIALEAKKDIRMKCDNLVQEIAGDHVRKIGGGAHCAVNGDFAVGAVNVSLAAKAKALLKGGAQAGLQGDGQAVIKGGMVQINSGAPPSAVNPKSPKSKKSMWAKADVPKSMKGKTSNDPETPRAKA